MHPKHLAASLTLLCAAAITLTASAQSTVTLEPAHRAYYLGQYGRALSLYESLAASGSAEAAERAAFMLLRGTGPEARRPASELARASSLLLQAARAGRPGAQFMLNMIENTD